MTYLDYLLNAGLVVLVVLGCAAMLGSIAKWVNGDDSRYWWAAIAGVTVIAFAIATLMFRTVV